MAEAADAADAARLAQADAFEKGVPSGRVVRVAHASHFVFISNEAGVLWEMRAFIDPLKVGRLAHLSGPSAISGYGLCQR